MSKEVTLYVYLTPAEIESDSNEDLIGTIATAKDLIELANELITEAKEDDYEECDYEEVTTVEGALEYLGGELEYHIGEQKVTLD